jgi:hypothetical protein
LKILWMKVIALSSSSLSLNTPTSFGVQSLSSYRTSIIFNCSTVVGVSKTAYWTHLKKNFLLFSCILRNCRKFERKPIGVLWDKWINMMQD